MHIQTLLYADYKDSNYGSRAVTQVENEQDAVNQAGAGITRFKIFERSAIEHEGEILKGEPKNYTPFIYTNTDEVLSLNRVVAEMEADLKNSKENLRFCFNNDSFYEACEGVIERFKAKDPATRYVREAGERASFIELQDGEKVYNKNKTQIWPAADNAPAQDLTPNL